jgi:hypothetical protein
MMKCTMCTRPEAKMAFRNIYKCRNQQGHCNKKQLLKLAKHISILTVQQ